MNKYVPVIVALFASVALGGCGGGTDKATEICKKTAAEMKLSGTAADEFVKQCVNPGEACKETAKQMQLAGAAADDFVKKCTDAAKAGTTGK